jgi:cation transport ATPase
MIQRAQQQAQQHMQQQKQQWEQQQQKQDPRRQQEQQRRQQEDDQRRRQQEDQRRQQEHVQRRQQEDQRRRQGFADYADPQWMQSISNSTICNWFYTFYLANLVVFFLVIGLGTYMFFRNKRQFTATNLFLALLQLIVAGTNMLFFYLICDRTLKP